MKLLWQIEEGYYIIQKWSVESWEVQNPSTGGVA